MADADSVKKKLKMIYYRINNTRGIRYRKPKEMYWQTPNSSNTVRHQRVIFFHAFGKIIEDKNLEVLTANRKRILIRVLLLYTCTHQPPPPKKGHGLSAGTLLNSGGIIIKKNWERLNLFQHFAFVSKLHLSAARQFKFVYHKWHLSRDALLLYITVLYSDSGEPQGQEEHPSTTRTPEVWEPSVWCIT